MRYFCNFDREGTGAISVLKCLEIARCLKMDQLHMLDALKDNDFSVESDTLVDFDSFEQCVMGCRERTKSPTAAARDRDSCRDEGAV